MINFPSLVANRHCKFQACNRTSPHLRPGDGQCRIVAMGQIVQKIYHGHLFPCLWILCRGNCRLFHELPCFYSSDIGTGASKLAVQMFPVELLTTPPTPILIFLKSIQPCAEGCLDFLVTSHSLVG